MENYSDEQLITNYLKGDEKTLEILIRRYLKPIYSFSYHFTGDVESAEDITQEVFIKVWRNIKKFNKEHKFKTWIFAIAKNTCLDWQKKKKTVPFSILDGEEKFSFSETIKDPAALPDELLEKRDVAAVLNKALEKLLPKYRMVLFLRYNDHLSFCEIAEILGESIDTVKTRHRRGIQKLKILITKKWTKIALSVVLVRKGYLYWGRRNIYGELVEPWERISKNYFRILSP